MRSLALIAFASFSLPVAAQDYPWMWNTLEGDWHDPESWFGKSLPNGYTVVNNGAGLMQLTSGYGFAKVLNLGVVSQGTPPLIGRGMLEITDSGYLLAETVNIASLSLSSITNQHEQTARVVVSGYDAAMSAVHIGVGMVGNATLIVEQGAVVDATTLSAGGMVVSEVDGVKTAHRADAKIELTGTGSLLNVTSTIDLGTRGDALMEISAGAKLETKALRIGVENWIVPGVSERGNGKLTISGGGSEVEVGGVQMQLIVGWHGDGEIVIESGGKLISSSNSIYSAHVPVIGMNIGGRGRVTVSGSGSQWLNDGLLYFGDAGRADVVIEDGGLIRSTGGFMYAPGAILSAQGSLIIRGSAQGEPPNAGTLETFYMEGTTLQTAEFDHAIVRAVANQSNLIRGFGSLTIQGGGLTIDTDSYLVGLIRKLSGTGGLTKAGEGVLTIGTVQGYGGPTIVKQGTLLLGVDDATGTGGIVLKNGTRLGKSVTTPLGITAAPLTIEGDATLVSPGGYFYPGAMTFTAEEATLSLSPLLDEQTDAIYFAVNGKVTTAGSLSITSTSELLTPQVIFTTQNDFGGELSIGSGVSLELMRFAGESVNNDLRIHANATVIARYSEQISDNHTTRVDGTLRFGFTNNLVETLGTLDGSGTIQAYNASSGTWNQTLQVHDGIFAGVMRDGSSVSKLNLTKLGESTLVLLNANAHTGNTTVKGGTLLAGHDDAFGHGALHLEQGVTIGKSVITDLSLGNAMTHLKGDATISSPGGAFHLQSVGVAAGSHTLTLAPASSGQTAETTTYVDRSLGGTGDLYLKASGGMPARFVLGGSLLHNTHTGLMRVGADVTLELQKANTTAIAGNLQVDEGGTAIIGKNEQISAQSRVWVEGRLAFGSDREITQSIEYLSLGMSGVVQSYNAYGMSGEWDQKLRINEGILYGTLADGSDNNALSLEKFGSEHLFIGGYGNVYSGDTHIREGSVTINTIAGSATGSGDVYVHANALLNGSARIDGNLYVTGYLMPGNSPGLLEVGGDLVFDAASTLIMEIWHGATAGLTYDQLKVDGSIVFDGTLFLLFEEGYEFTSPLHLFDVAGGSSGAFHEVVVRGLADDVVVSFDYTTGYLSIPEPGAMALLGCGAVGYLLMRRRKRLAA